MLYINKEITHLLQMMENPSMYKGMELSNRLQAWSILAMFNKVNQDLEQLNEQLDTALSLEAIDIDFDAFFSTVSPLQPEAKLREIARYIGYYKDHDDVEDHQYQINRLTDYLPNGKEGYLITPEVLGSFKTAMHQLCDEDRIRTHALFESLLQGLSKTSELLIIIRNKVYNPKPYLFNKLWNEIFRSYNNFDCNKHYSIWIDQLGSPDFDDLKDKQTQEIFEFLKTGFFRFFPSLTGSAVKKRKLKIEEDDLPVGTVIPEGFDVECAKFEKFIEWKDDILIMNYEKLGKYIYSNYREFKEEELFRITHFDMMMDLIHEDMAQLKPGLAKYLKRYEENQLKALLDDCMKILEPFKALLKDEYSPTILEEYMKKLLFESELKEEAKAKLSGQSKNKYFVSIIKALSLSYVFKIEFVKSDYAKALFIGIGKLSKESFERYFKDGDTDNKALNSCTAKIMSDLKVNLKQDQKSG